MRAVLRAAAAVLLAGAALLAGSPARGTEVYLYATRPVSVGTDPDGPAEQSRVEIARKGDGYLYRRVTELPGGPGRVLVIRAGADGALEEAEERAGGEVRRLRVGGDRVVWEARGRRKEIPIPPGSLPACRESLVLMARALAPGGRGQGRRVLLVDLSGGTTRGTLAVEGPETVETGAGPRDAIRVDLVLRLFIFRPRVHLWVAREPPHFLVRRAGKRSFFGPRYLTVLTGLGRR